MTLTTTLFIHSTGTLPAMWQGVPTDAATRLTPANLGYPPNAPLARGVPFALDAEVDHLIAQLPPEGDVHLYGHSYGAIVALKIGARLGARVRSAWLYEPVVFGLLAQAEDADATAVAEARAFLADSRFVDDPEIGGRDAWLEGFIDYWNRPGAWARLPAHMQAFMRHVGWKMYQEVRACFLGMTDRAALRLPGVAMSVVRGERSPSTSRAMAAIIAAENPGARLVDLPGTGHMAPITHPALAHASIAEHAAWAGALRDDSAAA